MNSLILLIFVITCLHLFDVWFDKVGLSVSAQNITITGNFPYGFCVDPSSGRVWIPDESAGTYATSVIDGNTFDVIATYTVLDHRVYRMACDIHGNVFMLYRGNIAKLNAHN